MIESFVIWMAFGLSVIAILIEVANHGRNRHL